MLFTNCEMHESSEGDVRKYGDFVRYMGDFTEPIVASHLEQQALMGKDTSTARSMFSVSRKAQDAKFIVNLGSSLAHTLDLSQSFFPKPAKFCLCT